MKLKKIMAFVLTMIMVLSLAACSGDNGSEGSSTDSGTSNDSNDSSSSDSSSSDAAATSDVELTIAIWDTNQEPGLTEIVNDFTEKTGVKAKIQVTPWDQYWTMLEAGATGGSLPDVFWMHSNEIARYSEYEMLLDLTDRIESSDVLDMSKFPQEIVEIYNWEGTKQYAIPKDIDTIALWYNKTMFDEAGLDYPDESWTWDTFRDAAEKLTKDDGSQYGFGLRPSNNQAGWYNAVYDMGGYIISDDKKSSGYDQPGTIEAIEFFASMSKDGLMPPYEVLAENEEHALFEAGKVAMITAGSWMLAELCNNEYVIENGDIAVLPKDADSNRRASIYNGLGWVAAENTDHPEEAWALIEYFGSEEAQQKQSDLGIVISAYEGTVDNWTAAYPDFNLQAYLDMMDDLVIRPYSKTTVRWENMANDKMILAWTGDKTAEEVCLEIADEMNALLAEE
jgi:multiple sugar transport system substrate-binding protein